MRRKIRKRKKAINSPGHLLTAGVLCEAFERGAIDLVELTGDAPSLEEISLRQKKLRVLLLKVWMRIHIIETSTIYALS